MKNWLLVILWIALIFLGSELPGAQVSEFNLVDFLVHKMAHIAEFGVLGFLLLRALKDHSADSHRKFTPEGGGNDKKKIFLVLLLSFVYGLFDEYHQSFTPGREPHIRDALIDLLGAGLAVFVIWKLPQKIQKRLLR